MHALRLNDCPLHTDARAQGDLSDIWDHTANRWGIDQAETYTRQLGVHVAMVAGNPALGRACPDVRMGYYKFQSGTHSVLSDHE